MTNFSFSRISATDGTWQSFQNDWKSQCESVGEVYEDYAPDSLGVLEAIAGEQINSVQGPLSQTIAACLRDEDDGTHYLGCMLNLAMVPGNAGMTLRVRHLLVSPLLDFGAADLKLYAEVLVHTLLGVVKASESDLSANNIRFHLRSPNDAEFFSAFGKALDGEKVFRSVDMRGSWLFIRKA
jgi:hypothetical protein